MKCYIDMDGVTVDLFDFLLRKYGKECPSGKGNLEKIIGLPMKEILGGVDWENLNKTPECDELIKTLKERFGTNTYIASSPCDARSAGGKFKWLEKNLPTFIKGEIPSRRVIFTRHKELLAKPDTILIDDYEKNVKKFITEGGKAILFPRQWNSLYYIEDSLTYVLDQLKLYRGFQYV